MFRLGVDTWLWACTFEEKHLGCIAESKELGAQVIDFSINDPFVFPAQEAAELVRKYEIDSVTSTALPLSCNPISPVKEEREAAKRFLKKLIDVTVELGAPLTGGVNYCASGYHGSGLRTAEETEMCAEYLHEICAYAADRGIDVAMEPVKRFESHFINTAAQAMEMISIVNEPNLKVHLDTFHMNIEKADFAEAILTCGDKLAHMHLVDSNRGAPGMGHVPWIDVFKALKKIDYKGAGCIETFNPQTLDVTAPLTFLTRRFCETPGELVEFGLRYLRAIETIVS